MTIFIKINRFSANTGAVLKRHQLIIPSDSFPFFTAQVLLFTVSSCLLRSHGV